MTPLTLHQVIFTSFILIFCATTHAQVTPSGTDKSTIFDLIQTDDVLEVNLEVDIEQIYENKNTNKYVMGAFQFVDKEGQEQIWNVETRARGKYRRRICEFPPLKLKFSKNDLKAGGLKKDNELKLVTHCIESKESKEYVFREYLVYQLYSILSDINFRTQLIRITYIDSKTKKKNRHYGMLIEGEETLEDRFNAKVCDDCYNLGKENFDSINLNVNDLFQYMIGNTDYSVPLIRNNKIFQLEDSSHFFVVPYDFDFSGLVNAPYAVPKSQYGMTSIRQRLFTGSATEEQELKAAKALFLSKKEEMISTVKDFEDLNKSSRKDITDFLDTFFQYLKEGEVIGSIYDPYAPK